MKFPVDLLADVSQRELELSAKTYMENLLVRKPSSLEQITLSDSTQITIDISKVGFAPLYGSNDKQKVLALFSPSDPLTAVALHLLGRWWTVDDVLKTADPSRNGAVEVKTVGERIVLYILNRIIYRVQEMTAHELPFLCHGEKDYAKILWKDGEAVGFYSVKTAGTLWNIYSTRRYQIPVMDSIFVRKNQRGQDLGLKMLQDYVLSFKENSLGLRYPLPLSMYKVCKKYLCQYPGDADLLWEVESVGEPNQRTNLSTKIHSMDLSVVSKSLLFPEESLVITQIAESDVAMDVTTTQIKEGRVRSTVEVLEEETVPRSANETELPAKPQGRSSGIRIEDIEAETPDQKQDLSQHPEEIPDTQTEDAISLVSKTIGEGVIDATATAEVTTTMASEEQCELSSVATAEQTPTEDDTKQSLNSHDSQIIVENVASEIEETNAEATNAGPEPSEEGDAQTLSNVGEGILLVSTTTTTTTTYTSHDQKQCSESDEVDDVTEENVISEAEVVEKLDGNMAEEPEESTAVEGDVVSVGDFPEGDVADDAGTEGTGVEQGEKKNEKKQSEEEATADLNEEKDLPPIVQRRSLRGRHKVVSKAASTKRSKGETAEPSVETEQSDANKNDATEEECVPSAENITTVTEVCTEECLVVLEHARPDSEPLLEEGVGDVAQESLTVGADSGQVMDEELPGAEELQGSKDAVREVPKMNQATVVLVDLKVAHPNFGDNKAVEAPAQAECPVLDEEQVTLTTPEEEQNVKPDVVVAVEGLDEGKMVNSEDISRDEATEGETDENERHDEDTADTETSGETEASFVYTRVLRSGKKTVKADKVIQASEKDPSGHFTAEEKCDAANTGPDMDKKDVESMEVDSATAAVPVEEEVVEQLEADSTVADETENLSATASDDDTSQEQAQVFTRALRSKTRSATASPAPSKTRRQAHKQGERTLRSRKTSTDVQQGTPQRSCKEDQNKEVITESTGVLVAEEKPEEGMEGAAQQEHLESEEKLQQPDDREDAASEGGTADENVDLKADEEQEVTTEADEQKTTEEQHEAVSETEASHPSEEDGEESTARTEKELGHTPVIFTRSLRSSAKTSSASPSRRSRRQKGKEIADAQNVEDKKEDGAELQAPSPAPAEVAPELTVNEEVETEAVADVQTQAHADTAGSTPEGDLEEDLSENVLPTSPDLPNVNEVLVDLKKTSPDVQDGAADAEESASEALLDTDAEEANTKEIVEEADVPAPDSVASELDDQQCTLKTTPVPLQEEANEEDGPECASVQEGDGKGEEIEKPVVLPEEECASSVDSVPSEDNKEVLVQQDEDGQATVEEKPVEDAGIMGRVDDAATTTGEDEPMRIDEDEGTAGDEDVEDEVTVRARKRRRSANVTPRPKSKRVCRQSKKEEKEDTTSTEESQEESPKSELEDIKEENGGEKSEENDVLKAGEVTEDCSKTKEDQEQESEFSDDRITADQPTVETRVLRKRRSAAAATPRRASKRVRSELKEAPEITEGSSEPEDKSLTGEAFVEESPIEPPTTQECQPALLEASESEQKESSDGEHCEKEAATDEGKATDDEVASSTQTKEDKEEGDQEDLSPNSPDVDPDRASIQEEPLVPDEPAVPARTSRSLRSKTKTSLAKPSHSPSKVEEQEGHQPNEELVETQKLDVNGEAEAKEAPLVEPPAGDDPEDQAEDQAKDQVEDQAEDTVDLTGESVADVAEDPEESQDSEEETAGSAEEAEDEDEWSLSEDEAIVIGSRVLRGRTVPSFVITPQSTPRRHSTKVQVLEENHSPVHKSSKRKSGGLTPASSLKRRSRV